MTVIAVMAATTSLRFASDSSLPWIVPLLRSRSLNTSYFQLNNSYDVTYAQKIQKFNKNSCHPTAVVLCKL